jgi:hypothetical protein
MYLLFVVHLLLSVSFCVECFWQVFLLAMQFAVVVVVSVRRNGECPTLNVT